MNTLSIVRLLVTSLLVCSSLLCSDFFGGGEDPVDPLSGYWICEGTMVVTETIDDQLVATDSIPINNDTVQGIFIHFKNDTTTQYISEGDCLRIVKALFTISADTIISTPVFTQSWQVEDTLFNLFTLFSRNNKTLMLDGYTRKSVQSTEIIRREQLTFTLYDSGLIPPAGWPLNQCNDIR